VTGNIWTDGMIRAFASLHRDPKQLSFTEIARLLSETFGVELTRNACIGKARRLGLPMRDNTPRPPRQRYLKPVKVERVEAPIEPIEARLPELRLTEGLTILQLREGDCKWPLGETYARPPFQYCGEPSLLGRSYCVTHMAKATGGRT
jgi:GcrA cell cycle regulator